MQHKQQSPIQDTKPQANFSFRHSILYLRQAHWGITHQHIYSRGIEGGAPSLVAVPVIVVNLGITLGGKLLLVSEGPNGFHTSQALTEVGIHRGSGCSITSLQLHIRAAIILLEEEVYNHERNHACSRQDTQSAGQQYSKSWAM